MNSEEWAEVECMKDLFLGKRNALAAYHYVTDDKTDAASYGGELRPVDNLLDKETQKTVYKEYAARARQMKISNFADDEKDAPAYFRWMYDRLYKPVLKTEYKNYGIYLTPVDLWSCTELYTARVVIDLSAINTETALIQVGNRVKKFSVEECGRQVFLYDGERIKKCLENSSRVFMKLPQIICFEESIKFKPDQIEKRSSGRWEFC
jgi:hypothetical protein